MVAGAQVIRGASAVSIYGDGELVGPIATLLGVLSVLVGGLALFLGWGMWLGRGWAWTISVILEGVGVVSSIYEIAIGMWSMVLGILFSLYVLWYLWRPHVRIYFGKGEGKPPSS